MHHPSPSVVLSQLNLNLGGPPTEGLQVEMRAPARCSFHVFCFCFCFRLLQS
jgi:hypothetical protein